MFKWETANCNVSFWFRKLFFLELSWQSIELRKICEDEEIGIKALSDAVFKGLKKRLSDLRAAKNVTDLVVGNLTLHDVGAAQYYTIELTKESKLYFRPSTGKALTAAGFDWSKVIRIKIFQIGNIC